MSRTKIRKKVEKNGPIVKMYGVCKPYLLSEKVNQGLAHIYTLGEKKEEECGLMQTAN